MPCSDPAPRLEHVDVLIFEVLPSSLRQVLRFNADGTARLLALAHDPREPVVCELLEAGVHGVLPHAELTCEALITLSARSPRVRRSCRRR